MKKKMKKESNRKITLCFFDDIVVQSLLFRLSIFFFLNIVSMAQIEKDEHGLERIVLRGPEVR